MFHIPFFDSALKHTSTIFSIDSSSVGVAIVEFSKEDRPKILWCKREEIVFQEELNFKRFLSSTLKTLEKVLLLAQKSGYTSIRDFHGVFSSPWYVSQPRIANFVSDKAVVVRKELVQEIIGSELGAFERENIKRFDVILGKRNKVIEARTMQTRLNGYSTGRPYGKKASEVELALYISMSSEAIVRSFTEVVAGIFHRATVSYHTLPCVAFGAIRDLLPASERFMFCEVSGEITDLTVIQRGSIAETASFPLGYNFLIRRVCQSFSTTPEGARSLIRSFLAGSVTESVDVLTKKDITYVSEEWLKSLRGVLEQSSLEYLLPDTVFLVSQNEFLQLFARFLEHEDLRQFTITNKSLSATVLTTNMLENFCQISKESTPDLFLILSTIFINKLYLV
jgi:hypothetical protein